MSPPVTTPTRLAALDQFRGYTVVGMCVVNFLAPFAAVHSVLKHNDTYFSYADTIMPGFLFVVGFAFRLTYLKRRGVSGRWPTVRSYIRRSGKLLLLSLLIYFFVGDIPRWFNFRDMPPEFEQTAREPEAKTGADDRSDRSPPETGGDGHALSAAATHVPSLVVSSTLTRLRTWNALSRPERWFIHWRILSAKLVKSELWETLAIIGATQLVVLPWIGSPFWIRLLMMAVLGTAHALFSYWVGWDFLYGVNGNWMSQAWMTGNDRGWDGGLFGAINWAVLMLGGTLAYDLVAGSASRGRAIARFVLWGLAFMAIGYAMSCLTRLYDLKGAELSEMRERRQREQAERSALNEALKQQRLALNSLSESRGEQEKAFATRVEEKIEATIIALEDRLRDTPDLSLAPSPVLPPWERLHGRSLNDLLAEPPFVEPPADDPVTDRTPAVEHRLRNYWMLGKRMPNLSFVTFATGFEFALLALFSVACDLGGLRLGLFRTFGTNPLATYFIHGGMALVLAVVVPRDAPLVICLIGFAVTFTITYSLVRYLEKAGLYWRL
jgi:predicted acyltransferase